MLIAYKGMHVIGANYRTIYRTYCEVDFLRILTELRAGFVFTKYYGKRNPILYFRSRSES